ncbi:MAG: glycosyltransferase family 2 protein [Anaerolineales bacterium]|nr:glycosyltransferase family 2 protein [Anaerolineales bacterium]
MPQSPQCSIVIRAYNEEKHIGRLLTGILEQTVQDVQIILVDSGSSDATVAIASRFPVELVSIKPEEFTFGRSLNIGCARATADFIVFASAHVYPVYPDWLECLLAPFEDPEIALVYGKQRGTTSTKFSEHQVFLKWFPEQSNTRQNHPFCNNANAAVRTNLWREKQYDESLPGLEDLDWAKWAFSQGFGISYAADAEIIHVHEETPKGVYNRYRREAIALSRIDPRQKFHFTDFLRLFLSNSMSDFWHALKKKQLLSKAGEIFWFRAMQFWGTYQGYRYAGPITEQLRQTFYYPLGRNLGGKESKRKVQPIRYEGN